MPHYIVIGSTIFGLLAALFLLHALLPEILFHWLHAGTFYKGAETERALSLTFDDGPDERYTPLVLDILKQYDIRATFFLVAENALKHPELVRRMVAEGHEIASHSSTHRHAWMQDPVSAFRDVRESKRILEDLTRQPIRFYRPPWGAFSLFSRLAITAAGVQPVLWSGRAMDWTAKQTSAAIQDHMIHSSRPGAIILCHDAGGAEGAPLRTIEALPKAIETLQALQYKLQPVGSACDAYHHARKLHSKTSLYAGYPLPRRLLIYTWSLVEWGFTVVYKIESVDEIFRCNRTVWSYGERKLVLAASSVSSDLPVGAEGASVSSANVTLHDGMPVLDLHLQNQTLATLSQADDPRSLIRGLQQTKQGLRHLAALLLHHPAYRDIQAITGVTLINRGIEALGFHIESLPSVKEQHRLQTYMRFLMGLYHPDGFRRLKEISRPSLRVKHLWMSKEELIHRYGVDAEGTGHCSYLPRKLETKYTQ